MCEKKELTKRLILVTSPPACGKTYVSKALSKELQPIVYLDKDTVIPLSKKVFEVANEPFDRSSDFFEKWVRDPEYEITVDFALEALEYADLCLINAPFTRELAFKKQHYIDYMTELHERLHKIGAKLTVIFVQVDPEIVRQRMIDRAKVDPDAKERDWWKIEHWEEYNAGRNYDPPTELMEKSGVVDEFFVVNNNSFETLNASMAELRKIFIK